MRTYVISSDQMVVFTKPIPKGLAKARTRTNRGFLPPVSKKKLTKMRGDLRSSSPNPSKW